MATWVAHLRIAEILLRRFDFDPAGFLAGNIGPDSGIPDASRTRFDPPKRITHWMAGDERFGKNIQSEEFFLKYLKGCTAQDSHNRRYSFLLGYYVHLLTDIEWSKMIHAMIAEDPAFGRRMLEDPEFIWEVKRDWYGLDFKYLAENPDNIFRTVFVKLDSMPDYLEYFPEGAVLNQIRYIQNFYTSENHWVNKTFTYLAESTMNAFVEQTAAALSERFEGMF